MADRKLIVQVIGDDSGLQRTLANSTKSINQFGRNSDRALGRSGGVSVAGSFEKTLEGVRKSRQAAEDLERQLQDTGTAAETTAARLATVAKAGAGFFALGRTLTGAGAALELFNGEASSTSRGLEDAGSAISSLISLDPAGFFKAAGASAARARENFDQYAKGITDANQAQAALKTAAIASALGFDAQAKAIKATVAQLTAAKTAADALAFAQRTENVTNLGGGRQARVRFRGAADDRGGPRTTPTQVAIDRASRNPIVVNTNVNIDGKKVGQATSKVSQADRRRNPPQKRGPNTSPH